MKSEMLNDWIQVVGIFGVILSLIFVGLELRQSRSIAVSEAYQSRAEIEAGVFATAASISEFQSGTGKLYTGEPIASLTPQEYVALEYIYGSSMTMWENDHYQYEMGYLSEEHWQKTRNHLKCELRKYYRTYDGWEFRASFENLIQELLTGLETDSSDCWSPPGGYFAAPKP